MKKTIVGLAMAGTILTLTACGGDILDAAAAVTTPRTAETPIGTEAPATPGSDLPVAQAEAVESAESYLSYTAFSRKGLIEQLEFEGFSTADATFAVDHITVDWNEQAAKSAKSYLDYSSFSRQSLIEQLEFEGFTSAQASYGARHSGLDAPIGTEAPATPGSDLPVAQAEAVESAESYLSYTAFSRKGLIEQLEFEGFSTADATFAVDHITVDWNEQAAKSAKSYLDYSSFSRQSLIEQLEFEGFTSAQASYGASQNGL